MTLEAPNLRPMWNVAAATVAGASHLRRGLPTQDAHQWKVLADGIFVAAIADGAGSAAPPFSLLAPAVRELVSRCFEDGHKKPGLRPTAREWREALTETSKTFKRCGKNSQHLYGSHLKSCPWCERTELLGGRDPYPSRQAVDAHQFRIPIPVRPLHARVNPQPSTGMPLGLRRTASRLLQNHLGKIEIGLFGVSFAACVLSVWLSAFAFVAFLFGLTALALSMRTGRSSFWRIAVPSAAGILVLFTIATGRPIRSAPTVVSKATESVKSPVLNTPAAKSTAKSEREFVATNQRLSPSSSREQARKSEAAKVLSKPSDKPGQTSLSPGLVARLSTAKQLYVETRFVDALRECDELLRVQPGNKSALELRSQISKTMKILAGEK